MAPHGTNRRYNHHGCRCVECKAAHAEYKRFVVAGGTRPMPFGPLEEHLHRIAELPQALRDVVEISRRRGHISVGAADRVAIALGLHPGLIWVDDWWITFEEEAA